MFTSLSKKQKKIQVCLQVSNTQEPTYLFFKAGRIFCTRRKRADADADEAAMRQGGLGGDRPPVDKSVNNSIPADKNNMRTADDVINDLFDED